MLADPNPQSTHRYMGKHVKAQQSHIDIFMQMLKVLLALPLPSLHIVFACCLEMITATQL